MEYHRIQDITRKLNTEIFMPVDRKRKLKEELRKLCKKTGGMMNEKALAEA